MSAARSMRFFANPAWFRRTAKAVVLPERKALQRLGFRLKWRYAHERSDVPRPEALNIFQAAPRILNATLQRSSCSHVRCPARPQSIEVSRPDEALPVSRQPSDRPFLCGKRNRRAQRRTATAAMAPEKFSSAEIPLPFLLAFLVWSKKTPCLNTRGPDHTEVPILPGFKQGARYKRRRTPARNKFLGLTVLGFPFYSKGSLNAGTYYRKSMV